MNAPQYDPDHYVDLTHGVFTRPSGLTDLSAAFRRFSSHQTRHLCVFFHGGLVDAPAAMQTAQRLIGPYTDEGEYPFFFIWHTGLWDALRGKLRKHREKGYFLRAAHQKASMLVQKIEQAAAPGRRRGGGTVASRAPLKAQRSLKELARQLAPYETRWRAMRAKGVQLEFGEADVHKDAAITAELRRAAGPPKAPKRSHFRPARLWQRLAAGRDHGLFTSIIEELYIDLWLNDEAARIWRVMKHDTDLGFTVPDAGGTAFLQELAAAARAPLRLTLIGHSAGSVYVQRFVEALQATEADLDQLTVEVILLAAAISFERMYSGLHSLRKQVKHLRTFGLNDQRECRDPEMEPEYSRSLLYFVSALAEDDPWADKPLVGMQRFWKEPQFDNFIDVANIRGFIGQRTVWSPAIGSTAPGWRSDALYHGEKGKGGIPRGFPTEAETLQSNELMLRQGFDPP